MSITELRDKYHKDLEHTTSLLEELTEKDAPLRQMLQTDKNYFKHFISDLNALIQSEDKERLCHRVEAISNEDIETDWWTIEKGSKVEGYLNSYHLLGCYSIQVELTTESGGVEGCSGIVVVNVPVKKGSIRFLESEKGGEG